jgi:hypothetical protein
MSDRKKWIPIAGFVVSVLAMGVPYWSPDYGGLNLPEALYGPGLGLVGIFAALAVGSGATTFWKGLLIMGSAAPTVVMLRVIVECLIDPTAHNLWPFEVAIAIGVGFPWAFGGAVAGWLLLKLRATNAPEA